MAESDEALIQAYGAGRREALGQLVQRRFEGAYRVALRALGDPGAAEDAACEAFAAVTREARRFEAGRAFGPWFAAILANAIRKQERSRQRRTRHEARAAVGPFAPERDGDGPLDAERVAVALQALPLDLRLPLALHFQDGRTHAEVATALGCPVGTASSRIRRGLEELRATLVGAAGAALPDLEAALRAAPAGATPAAPGPGRLEALARALGWGRRAAAAAAALFLASGAVVLLLSAPPPPSGVAAAPELGPVPLASATASVSAAPGGGVAAPAGPRAPAPPAGTDAPEGGEATAGAPAPVGEAPVRLRRIVGRVVDEERAPVAGARVVVSRCDPDVFGDEDPDRAARARAAADAPVELRVRSFLASRWRRPVTEVAVGRTSDDGRFELAVDVLDTGLEVSASVDGPAVAHGGLEGRLRPRPAADGTLDVYDLHLRPCEVHDVTVRADGRPLAGAEVMLVVPTSDAESDDFWARAVTGPDGSARLVDPHGGAQTLIASAPGRATEVRRRTSRVWDEPFDLAPAVALTTRVLDPAGQPLVDAEVVLHSVGDHTVGGVVLLSARTGVDGGLVLPALAEGRRYALVVRSPRADLLDAELELRGGEPLASVRLQAHLALTVHVSGPEPLVAEDHVVLQRRHADGRWRAPVPGRTGGAPALTFHDEPAPGPGEARFEKLSAGTYRAIAHHEACTTLVSEPVEVAPGAPVVLTLRLAPGLPVRGRLLDADGAPLPGVGVSLRIGDHQLDLGLTDEEGVYETRQLPASDVEVVLVARRFLEPPAELPLGPDRTRLPDFQLPPSRGR